VVIDPPDTRTFLDTTVEGWRDRLAGSSGRTRAELDALLPPTLLASPRALDDARGPDGAIHVVSAWSLARELARISDTPLVLGAGEGTPRVLDPRARTLGDARIPGTDTPLEVADAWVLPVGHWSQYLWSNLLALGPFLWGRLVGTGPAAALRLGWAALRAGSLQPEDVAARLNVLGPGARVHRSAVVEGCVLGPGARIGAGSVVRGAVLGEGAVVEEMALVEAVIAGPGARIQRRGAVKFSVLGPESEMAGAMQLGVLGRGACLKHGAVLMDQSARGDVRVTVDGTAVRAPFGLCGVHVHDGAWIGGGVAIAPGREIAAGLRVVGAPDAVVRRTTLPHGTRSAQVRDGRLEAIP
jgi:carbonic anhydrase/acetyltransferase-like protein (isoleucine patch superfamily)